MATQRSLLLCFLVAGAFGTCVAPVDITLNFETWVPETPYVGEASYIVVNGTNHQTTSFTAAFCQITMTQGSYSYGSEGYIPCWTDEVKPGANFRFQTGAVWVPQDAPLGTYTWELCVYTENKSLIGCWCSSVSVEEDPRKIREEEIENLNCANYPLEVGNPTWNPVYPHPGYYCYLTSYVQNYSPSAVTASTCSVTFSLGSTSFGTGGRVACGAIYNFSESMNLVIGSILVPSSAPVGYYNTVIQIYGEQGQTVGCWSGTTNVVPYQDELA